MYKWRNDQKTTTSPVYPMMHTAHVKVWGAAMMRLYDLIPVHMWTDNEKRLFHAYQIWVRKQVMDMRREES